MTDQQPSCAACQDRGWHLVNNRTEAACGLCPAGAAMYERLRKIEDRTALDRTDSIRALVNELAHSWTDRDKDTHAGLIVLVSVHTEPVNMNPSGDRAGKVTGSPMACALDVVALISDITVGVLAYETELRHILGFAQVDRSGSLRSLVASLDTIPDLWQRAHEKLPEHRYLKSTVVIKDGKPKLRPGAIERDLKSWHRKCRELLGAERRWSRVPATCSACGENALRMLPRTGSVICTQCGATWSEEELHWLDDVSARATP